MDKGIIYQSLVPVRAKPGHAQEQVTQLLFGELYVVEEKKVIGCASPPNLMPTPVGYIKNNTAH